MPATMSVLGLFKADDTIFNGMVVPAAFTSDDKDILIDNILMETAELETLYTSPDYFAFAVDRWSRKELPTWERIYRVSSMNYNPLENYNRTETSSETTQSTEQHSGKCIAALQGT